MEKLEIVRNGESDPFSIVLSRGNDSIRCMVTVEAGINHSDGERHEAALLKADALAVALHEALCRGDPARTA